jgi:GT2 family glycosyltransferase
MIKFSILIPIHNRLQTTKQGLKSLYAALNEYEVNGNSKCKFEIIVIDDGSKDGSSEWIAGNYPAVHLLKGDGNLWWSGAINKGAGYAVETLNSDYLLLWNDDIFPDAHFFTRAAEIFCNLPFEDAVIGSRIMHKDSENKTWSVGGYFNKLTGDHGLYRDPEIVSNDFFECDWQPGMGTFVPTSIIKEHGLSWDENRFPQYHGDSDFTLRCKEKGIKVATCLTLVIYNHAEAYKFGKTNSFKDLWVSLIAKRSNYNFGMRFSFYKKHGISPFVYWGLLKTYFIYIGAFLKNKIAKT